MRSRVLSAGGMLGLLACGVLFAVEPPKVAAPAVRGTVQELIFFTAEGPVRVRIAASIGGDPAADVWRASLDKLFAYCDRDGDGSLDGTERQIFNRSRGGEYVLLSRDSYVVRRPMAIRFSETNGRVGRAAFRDGMRDSGSGSVAATGTPPRGDSGQLADALFKLLDTDGDGKLSVAELKASGPRLIPLDADDDELITADELLERFQSPYAGFVQVLDSYDSRGPPVAEVADVYLGTAGEAVSVRDLLATRDGDNDGTLTPSEFGCDAQFVAPLDVDGDGRIDADELAAWLRGPVDLTLNVSLNDSRLVQQLGPFLTDPYVPLAVAGNGRLTGRVKKDRDGTFALALNDVRFRFAADAGSGTRTRSEWDATAERYRTEFKELAAKGGDVDRQKLAESPTELNAVAALFDLADRNKDGKMSAEELNGLIHAIAGAKNCRIAVSVSDTGRGLFELIDADGDGQLGPRERVAAPALVSALDRDGDGKLARDELPRGYTVTARLASVDLFQNNNGIEFISPSGYGGVGIVPASPPVDVPEWFRNADRNGDGDVSAREFAGPPALFRKIDANGDGLVSPEEARAFEKRR